MFCLSICSLIKRFQHFKSPSSIKKSSPNGVRGTAFNPAKRKRILEKSSEGKIFHADIPDATPLLVELILSRHIRNALST